MARQLTMELIVTATFFLPLTTVRGQESDTLLDRFMLFTECSPVAMLTRIEDEDGDLKQFTVERLERFVRSRLRQASLYEGRPRSALPFIRVDVSIVGPTFHVRMALWKSVNDLASQTGYYAPTWNRSALGLHGYTVSHVLGFLADQLDDFVDEYLRVNGEACHS